MRLTKAILHDLRFQYRHGFHHVYLLITILYIVALRLLPDSIRTIATLIAILSDPSILGYFFIGGLVLLEKGQNLHANLFSTPLRPWEYFTAKVISLGLISLASSLLIALFVLGPNTNFLALSLGVFPIAGVFTLLGFAPALKFKTIAAFLLISPVYIILFFLPLLDMTDAYYTPAFLLLPTQGAQLLIRGSLDGISPVETVYSGLIMVLWLGVTWGLADRVLKKYIESGGGD